MPMPPSAYAMPGTELGCAGTHGGEVQRGTAAASSAPSSMLSPCSLPSPALSCCLDARQAMPTQAYGATRCRPGMPPATSPSPWLASSGAGGGKGGGLSTVGEEGAEAGGGAGTCPSPPI
eukprot:2933207-Rhodomonas_salina.2